MNPHTHSTFVLCLLIGAILAFLLAAVAGGQADGEVILNAVQWASIGGALFTALHLPPRS